jgi:pilus assembly protein CpaB
MLIVALALVLAVLGTIGVLAYVRQANTRALSGVRAVTVLVARQGIASGTTANAALSGGLLVRQKMPASAVPADAVRAITPDLRSLVMSSAIQPGQLLLRAMLVHPSQATGGVAIPKGDIAVTVQLCLPAAVAGYVHAGSQVALFDTYGGKELQESCGQQHQAESPTEARTRLVLTRVEVLSVGTAPSGVSGSAGSSTLSASSDSASSEGAVFVTLALSQANAEKLITVEQAGVPYLGLLTSQSVTGPDTTLPPLFPAIPTSQP